MNLYEAIRLYVGINESRWNGYPVSPGPFACISPVFGSSERTKKENPVNVPPYSLVLEDSGAFCDGPDTRLTFQEAFDRQKRHSDKYGYTEQVEARASYDLLIDEKWEGGSRFKHRWSEGEAWEAVKVTVEAAKFLSNQNLKSRVLSAQGTTSLQYKECAIQVLNYLNPETDIFGLGGWCISGKMPKQLRPSFEETILEVIPVLEKAQVKRVHIWGVIDVTFLCPLLYLCDQAKIQLSTDSAGPQCKPAAFGTWGYRGWRDRSYQKPKSPFLIGLHRALHAEYTRDWLLSDARKLKYYYEPRRNDEISMFDLIR